ncbi:MAG: hypothetical protein IPG88_11050 [Gemmatimonadetes bacterium]|nr:hypothetical protein [Gemmatimonadota bacterium]
MSRIHIELQRVQQWLFAVPRLRAMIGANTRLGEALRVDLPALARTSDRGWHLNATSSPDDFSVTDDPIAVHDDPAVQDRPARDLRDGIVARDGGHFEAEFESQKGAQAFAAAAQELIERELPGLRYRIFVDDQVLPTTSRFVSSELPMLSVCEWTGHGLASASVRQGIDVSEVSVDAAMRHRSARLAENGKAQDIATLLTASTSLRHYSRPRDFEALAGNGYLAVIHADGNGVGSGAPSDQVLRARFFHRNRVLVRAAIAEAVNTVVPRPDVEGDTPIASMVILMVGGDDILIVCRASIALRFVVELSTALENCQAGRLSDEFHITLGVGVAIGRPSLPFHRLHAVAEQLAASAKRRVRGVDRERSCSVVDWAVYTNSWADDPGDVRRRDWVRGSAERPRVLSRRPMPVLRPSRQLQGAAPPPALETLQGLVEGAACLERAARSQLRWLAEQLNRGETLTDLAYRRLTPDSRRALQNAGITEIWSGGEDTNTPRSTSLLDLVEVYEIGRLGSMGSTHHAPASTQEDDEIYATAPAEEPAHAD